jgi:RHS repeat-associated protein
VLATVSDVKLPAAKVLSFTDYYAFGSAMPGRSGGAGYRYGFNGKEDDAETGWQDYGMRMYNPRLARFFTVDPIAAQYPELTPYQFASNSPIDGVDMDGLEHYYAANGLYLGHINSLDKITDNSVIIIQTKQAEVVGNDIEKIHRAVMRAPEFGLNIGLKLAINHDELLDRANWMYAEGRGYYPLYYAFAIKNLREGVKDEGAIYTLAMKAKNAEGETVTLDKEKYLSGQLENKTPAKFWENRNNPEARGEDEWRSIEAVVRSLSGDATDPTNRSDNWRGRDKRGGGEAQGKAGGRYHAFIIYGKNYGNTIAPIIPEEFRAPASVNMPTRDVTDERQPANNDSTKKEDGND